MLLKKYSSLIKESRKHYGTIYKITDPINNLIYVGRTINLHRRLKEYEYKSNKVVYNKRTKWGIMVIINNIGVDNILIDLLDHSESAEDLIERETYWIRELRSHDPEIGYNTHTGIIGETLRRWRGSPKILNGKFNISGTSIFQYEPQRVIVYKDNYFKIFDSIGECARYFNVLLPTIRKSLTRAQYYKGHFIFYYDAIKRNKIIDMVTSSTIIRPDYRKKKRFFVKVGRRLNGLNLETIENRFHLIY